MDEFDRWDHKFMAMAEHVATWSKDRSRKVGCVIVGPNHEIRTTGYNGFPRGADDDAEERHERPTKYSWTEHAERNAIYNAARVGIPLERCTLYATTLFICVDCARAIAQVGLDRVVAVKPDFDDPTYGEQFRIAERVLLEAGVVISYYETPATPQRVL